MKKRLCGLLALVCLLSAGCTAAPHTDSDAPATTTTTTTTAATTTTTTTTAATTTTTTARTWIGEDRALAIAEQHWGIRSGDRDPKTGYLMTLMVRQTPTEETPEYRIVLQWLVEVDGQPSHQSMVDDVRIDAYSGEVLSLPIL